MDDRIKSAIASGSASIIVAVSAADLRDIVSEMVRSALADAESAEQDGMLSKSEVMSMLSVSGPTLNRWEKSGYLVPLRAGRKVFYRKSDIEAAIATKIA